MLWSPEALALTKPVDMGKNVIFYFAKKGKRCVQISLAVFPNFSEMIMLAGSTLPGAMQHAQ